MLFLAAESLLVAFSSRRDLQPGATGGRVPCRQKARLTFTSKSSPVRPRRCLKRARNRRAAAQRRAPCESKERCGGGSPPASRDIARRRTLSRGIASELCTLCRRSSASLRPRLSSHLRLSGGWRTSAADAATAVPDSSSFRRAPPAPEWHRSVDVVLIQPRRLVRSRCTEFWPAAIVMWSFMCILHRLLPVPHSAFLLIALQLALTVVYVLCDGRQRCQPNGVHLH
ncbi:hypothetical protein Q1695_003120 [Nippostrongylus brasiliensis]|nr:hypothetical protein Q1695_003120 [Nippostrongylus brasiliensis]